MLILKTDQEEGRLTISSVRKNYYRQIRRNQLLAIFQTLRKNIFYAQSQIIMPNQPKAMPIDGQMPMNCQQIYTNYLQYLSYVARATQPRLQLPAIQNNESYNKNEPLKIIMPEKKPTIYFQKNGFVVYKNLIGKGSYSKVWQGANATTGEKVAVKEVKQLEQNEVKCLSQLTSPHIIKVLSIFKNKSKTYIVLQFCEKNLREELVDCQYGLDQILIYFEQIVAGIDLLQSRNILHRDLKFQNILIKERSIKIADFGLAKFLGNQLEVSSRRCGTPYTMAPEIYFSDSYKTPYTIKCDIWSIGVILHQMLYQKHPFKGNRQSFKRQQRCKVTRKFGILDKLIDECLVFSPVLRIDWEQFKQIFLQYLKIKNNQGRIAVENTEIIQQLKMGRVIQTQNIRIDINKLQNDIKGQIINFKKIKQQKNKGKKEEKIIMASPVPANHEKVDQKRNNQQQMDYIKRQKKDNANSPRKANKQIQKTVNKLIIKKGQTKGEDAVKSVLPPLSTHQNTNSHIDHKKQSMLQMSKLRLIIQFICITSVVTFFICIF